MNAGTASPASRLTNAGRPPRPLGPAIAAGLASWAVISLGFLGLKMLMQERPEFVGPPLLTSKAVLVQDSPRLVARKVSDDVSVIRPVQPESAEVQFRMQGRRDYRGLKTISDMSGQFAARYTLTNQSEEAWFILFKCPHPRTESNQGEGLLAAGLKLQASLPGLQENAREAWLWSGAVPSHSAVTLEVAYEVTSLRGVSYRITEQNGMPLNQVRVTFHRQDLPSLRLESGDGTIPRTSDPVVWEQRNFLGPNFFSAHIVEGRNLFSSLSQLVEIGPLITLLFLLAVIAVVWTRQELTVLQLFTISAAYALYFPLIVYLSSRFSFAVALTLAAVVPGALLVNYARWLMGGLAGLAGGTIFLLLYQVFPTLAAFSGWNRGMVLLGLGIVTLWVLINLQNRALRARAATVALFFALAAPASPAGIQVLLPAELGPPGTNALVEKSTPLVSYGPAHYQLHQETTHFRVQARLPLEIVQPGELAIPLFTAPVHLEEHRLESAASNLVRLVTLTNRLHLFAPQTGPGTLTVSYRAPIENRDGKTRVQIPLFLGTSGALRIESRQSDLEITTGSLWNKTSTGSNTVHEVGVAGDGLLALEWREQSRGAPLGGGRPAEGADPLYGIKLTRAQNLTVINSDGSCTHFAEFELPAFLKEEFRLRLPPQARLISVLLNGTELNGPLVEDQVCRIRLPGAAPAQAAHRLSFRLAYPPARLGFVGSLELPLPEAFQTAGQVEWMVALPDGFAMELVSSNLELQKTPADTNAFGNYGSILKSHPQMHFAKTLVPAGPISLNLKYRQRVAGF